MHPMDQTSIGVNEHTIPKCNDLVSKCTAYQPSSLTPFGHTDVRDPMFCDDPRCKMSYAVYQGFETDLHRIYFKLFHQTRGLFCTY
jgi:hypothetical protein